MASSPQRKSTCRRTSPGFTRAIGAWTVPLPVSVPAYDGEVFPADHTLQHGFAEQGGGEHIFGDDDQAARVGIQPVDAAERRISPFAR